MTPKVEMVYFYFDYFPYQNYNKKIVKGKYNIFIYMGNKFSISEEEKKQILIQHKLLESDSTVTAGLYNGPVELGSINTHDNVLAPFIISSPIDVYEDDIMNDNIKTEIGTKEIGTPWKKIKKMISGTNTESINEDLAVWFGTKKKPKGSKQPKGPWVNICRKVDGKHPPCGRSEAKPGSYPKCRAAGVAGKMTDAQKKSACQQKRRAEKKDPKVGKGNKPTMVSYKPKKKKTNESEIDKKIYSILESFLRG
jgi:hypothetical protein